VSAQVCVLCAKPANAYVKLGWDEKGRLTHGDSHQYPDCREIDPEVTCEHPGIECGELYALVFACLEPAAGFSQCSTCDLAHKTTSMSHAEFHMRAADGEFGPKGVTVPAGGNPPFYYRIHAWDEAPEEGVPAGTKGLILETNFGAPWLVCPDCAERKGGAWRRYKPTGDPDEPGASGDPWDRVPADGEWRRIGAFAGLVGLGDRKAKDLVREWARDGRLEVKEEPTAAGGSPARIYRRQAAEQ